MADRRQNSRDRSEGSRAFDRYQSFGREDDLENPFQNPEHRITSRYNSVSRGNSASRENSVNRYNSVRRERSVNRYGSTSRDHSVSPENPADQYHAISRDNSVTPASRRVASPEQAFERYGSVKRDYDPETAEQRALERYSSSKRASQLIASPEQRMFDRYQSFKNGHDLSAAEAQYGIDRDDSFRRGDDRAMSDSESRPTRNHSSRRGRERAVSAERSQPSKRGRGLIASPEQRVFDRENAFERARKEQELNKAALGRYSSFKQRHVHEDVDAANMLDRDNSFKRGDDRKMTALEQAAFNRSNSTQGSNNGSSNGSLSTAKSTVDRYKSFKRQYDGDKEGEKTAFARYKSLKKEKDGKKREFGRLPSRRKGRPAEKIDEEGINEKAPLDRYSSTWSNGSSTINDTKALTKEKGGDGDDEGEKDPLAHLDPYEAEIIRRQTKVKEVKAGYFTLFRFTTPMDVLVLIGSFLCAVTAGTAMPLMTVILGNLAGTFSQYSQNTLDMSQGGAVIGQLALYMCIIGVGEFVTVYLCMLGFIYTGQRIAARTREEYLKAILRQNIGFFDAVGAGEVTKRITSDVSQMQDGISEKVALTIIACSIFCTAFVIGFIRNWYLTLVLTSTVVMIVIVVGIGAVLTGHYSGKALEAYSPGGSVAQEVISAIRTTTAYGIQERLALRYRSYLEKARKWEARKKFAIAMMIAGVEWTVSANDGLAYWQGARFLVDGKAEVSAIVTIATNILIGAAALGTVGPHIEAFTNAIAAGARIFGTIDRVSPLDPLDDSGVKPTFVRGAIELRNVRHIYPSRPDVEALRGISLYIPPGKTTALVGASGSGKSSIVGLLERFYDPVSGSLLLDGTSIREINLRFLRQHIALVGQEPTLFNTTIEENIAYGLTTEQAQKAGPEGKKQLIIEAAKMANAHNFITQLEKGYETNVGEAGGMLSGGQKQRIAIARAIVSNPRILILDEATSALDTVSESVVQTALDRASKGRTTIVVAHRLSTIKNADNIVVMEKGTIIEQGKHDQLLQRRGAYHALVAAQQVTGQSNLERIDEALENEEHKRYSFGRIDQIVKRVTAMCAQGPTPSLGPVASGAMPSHNLTREVSNALKRRSITSVNGFDITSPTAGITKVPTQQVKPEDEKQPHYTTWDSVKFIASFNKEESKMLVMGLFWSIIGGCVYPTSVVFQAKCITTLFLPVATQSAQLIKDVSFWAALFFMLAWISLISFGGQGLTFAHCSERLTFRARDRAFRAILRQDISFFDRDENTTGSLTSFLFTETTYLAGMSGATLGAILTFTTTMTASVALGIGVGWKLGLVCTTCVPVLFAGGFLRLWVLARFESRMQKENEYSASRACEATSAIRTVASLTLEGELCDKYRDFLIVQRKRSLKSVAKSSTLYAFSQSALLWSMALGFWYGGNLIISHEYQNLQLFICLSAIIVGAQTAGVIFSFAPDMGKAKHAAQSLQTLFDRRPKIDSSSEGGERVDSVNGAIRLRNVYFNYPTRPDQPILRSMNLNIRPGQFVALVGASGCGKSTIIQLLERFYDPVEGSVCIDGREVSDLNINEYRSHLALVAQEPAIYDGTIRENIIMGVTARQGEVTESMIEKACRDANIYDFIISLPEGFNTQVGSKGSMLSGGQKQRIAIARALIRNPKVLLLDEATSALDSESEKVVQEALDAAAKGRTTIAVAHRLSTIQNADVIYVIDKGQVVEQGTHQELLEQRGKYFELVKLQSLGLDV